MASGMSGGNANQDRKATKNPTELIMLDFLSFDAGWIEMRTPGEMERTRVGVCEVEYREGVGFSVERIDLRCIIEAHPWKSSLTHNRGPPQMRPLEGRWATLLCGILSRRETRRCRQPLFIGDRLVRVDDRCRRDHGS